MYFLAIFGWKSGDSRKRKKNSYTSWKGREGSLYLRGVLHSCTPYCSSQHAQTLVTWRWGQAASSVGSSSSGSNSAPVGLEEGGSVRKRLTEN